MSFQTVEKAVELKRLLDHVHRFVPKIGRCFSLEKDFKDRHFKEESDITDEQTTKINGIREKLNILYDLEGYHMEEYRWWKKNGITVLGKEFEDLTAISRENVEVWYASGASSGFGNVMEQQTQHDTRVRSSKELDTSSFSVTEGILKEIGDIWSKHFVPKSVRVEPYKLVIYGPGDHFSWHKDTPEEKLCGTFLVSLFEDCEPKDAFEITQGQKSAIWSCPTKERWTKNGWCGFYPDIPHRVLPLQSGYRAVLSFKVFVKDGVNEPWGENIVSKMVTNIVDDIQQWKAPLGILLKHHYGYDSKTIYGCDKILLDVLEQRNVKVDIKPVLIKFKGVGSDFFHGDDSMQNVCSSVYYLTDNALDTVRTGLEREEREETENLDEYEDSDDDEHYDNDRAKRQKMDTSAEILFVDGVKKNKTGIWGKAVKDAAENLGNESRPHSETSVYVRYAAILKPQAASQE